MFITYIHDKHTNNKKNITPKIDDKKRFIKANRYCQ